MYKEFWEEIPWKEGKVTFLRTRSNGKVLDRTVTFVKVVRAHRFSYDSIIRVLTLRQGKQFLSHLLVQFCRSPHQLPQHWLKHIQPLLRYRCGEVFLSETRPWKQIMPRPPPHITECGYSAMQVRTGVENCLLMGCM